MMNQTTSPIPSVPVSYEQYNSYNNRVQQHPTHSYSQPQSQPQSQSQQQQYHPSHDYHSHSQYTDHHQNDQYNTQYDTNLNRQYNQHESQPQASYPDHYAQSSQPRFAPVKPDSRYPLDSQSMNSNMFRQYPSVPQQQRPVQQPAYPRFVSTSPTYSLASKPQDPSARLVKQTQPPTRPVAPMAFRPPTSSKRTSSSDGRRTRNLKTPHALKVLKYTFSVNRKPAKETMRSLQHDTGCTYPEICRWFRNERHKEKRMQNNQMLQAQTSTSEVDESSRPASPSSRNSGVSSQSSRSATPTVTDAHCVNPVDTPSVLPQAPQFSEWISTFTQSFEDDHHNQQLALAAMIQQQAPHYEH